MFATDAVALDSMDATRSVACGHACPCRTLSWYSRMNAETDELPLAAGDTATTVQFSPCVGGHLRTWSGDGTTQLWSTPDADWLLANQGTGRIARTLRGEYRYREAGMLVEDRSLLFVPARPVQQAGSETVDLETQLIRLEAPLGTTDSLLDDFIGLLGRSIEHCKASGEFLVVELGGWDAPEEPYCLFITLDEGDGAVNMMETVPLPQDSDFWTPHLHPGSPTANLSAPATPETTDVAPRLMCDAIREWGVHVWDLALTFGTR